MAETVQLKPYKYTVNGVTYYEVVPDYNVSKTYTPATIEELQGEISKYSTKTDDWSQNYLQSLQSGLQKIQTSTSPYVLNQQGVLATQQEVASQELQQQQIASGQVQNIGTAQAPLTVPSGTPSPQESNLAFQKTLPPPTYQEYTPSTGQTTTVTPTPGTGDYIQSLTTAYQQQISPNQYQMTPTELSGGQGGINAYNQRIAQLRGEPTPSTTTPSTTTYQTPVATSDALRTQQRKQELEDRRKELEQAFGLIRPVAQDLFTEADKTRLTTARTERTTLEDEMASILEERLKLDEEFRIFKQTSGEAVSEAGRIGMESEEGRKYQNRLDALNRRELVAETKLTNRNSIINELMGLQRQEYTDAVSEYNTRFSQALQIYNLFDKEQDELKTNAKASLDTLANAYGSQIKAGKLTFDKVSPIQWAKLEELELQSGQPIGSTRMILQTLKPGEEKLYSGVDDFGNFVYITKDASGTINTQTIQNAVPQKTTTSDIKFTATEQKNYEAFKSEISSYSNKQEALADLQANKTAIIQKIGQSGYDLLVKDINSFFSSATSSPFPTIEGQTGPFSLNYIEEMSKFLFK